MRIGRVAAVIAGLVLLTSFALGGVARNGFIPLDDPAYLTNNAAVASGLSPRGLVWAFTVYRSGNWHPLTWLSHQLDVQLFGMNAGAHHLVSLALHTANALLLLALLRALTGTLWPSALVAALFAVHPLHVESVAWASERKDVLSTLLALAAAMAYLRAARRRRVLRSAAVPALFALALMAKPMPVTLPFLLLLLDWWPLGRWSPTPGAPPSAASPLLRLLPPAPLWLEKLPLFLLAAASCAVTVAAQSRGGAIVASRDLAWPVRVANAAISAVRYLQLALWPRGLAAFYPHPTFLPSWWRWAGALVLLAAASFLAARAARSRPAVAVGWLWYLGTLAPVLGLVQVGAQAMADRYTYLPLAGIFVAAAWGSSGAARLPRRPAAAAAAVAALLVLLAVLSARQVATWRDGATLFGRALEVAGAGPGRTPAANPALAFLYNLSGLALVEKGQTDEAIVQYRLALTMNPYYPDALNNLGRVIEAKGRTDEAIALYRQAADNDPQGVEPRNNLGASLLSLGRAEEALPWFREALAIDPRSAPVLGNLGVALGLLGRRGEADQSFRAALAADGRYAPAHFNLAISLLAQGRREEALRSLRETLRLRPDHAAARALLGHLADPGSAGASRP